MIIAVFLNTVNVGEHHGLRRLFLPLPAILSRPGTIYYLGPSYRRLKSDLSRDIMVWQFNRRQDIWHLTSICGHKRGTD